MAEIGIDPVVLPEENQDSLNVVIISEGKSGSPDSGCRAHSHARRASIAGYSSSISIAKPDSVNGNSSMVVPRYLRASTSSRHDFCKYGTKNAFETKEKHPFVKRTVQHSSQEETNVEAMVRVKQKKETSLKHKANSDTSNRTPEPKRLSNTKSFKPKLTLPTIYSQKPRALANSKTQIPKHKPSYTEEIASPEPPEIIKREILLPTTSVEVPSRQMSTDNSKMQSNERKTNDLSDKPSAPARSTFGPTKKAASSSYRSDGMRGKGGRNGKLKTCQTMMVSGASAVKSLASISAYVPPKMPVSRRTSLKSTSTSSRLSASNNIHKSLTTRSKDEVPEKTLHVIKTETEDGPKPLPHANALTPSSHDIEDEDEEVTDCSDVESVSESDEQANRSGDELVKDSQNNTLRKCRPICAEDGNSAPVNLKFWTGMIMDLNSDNSNPRRLRFRKRIVLGEEQDGSGRDLRKQGIEDKKNGSDGSLEKVVLKHQDVQGKKDVQSLLNDVIEQTASKLVESRKSKVEALVGAFETVISLLESKPLISLSCK